MSERLTLANALVGFLLPQLIALINQRKWVARTKSLVAFGACAVAGILTSYVAGDLVSSDLLLSIFTVFGVARVSYAGLWHPTGVTPAIEKATSVNGG
jgi:hypothetical protein